MPDLTELIANWGYAAIFLVVVGGNLGLPVPEETVLIVAGYLAWQETLRLPWVLLVGVVSAVAGDNLGYWIGRRYGRRPLERYGPWVSVTPERLETVWGFVRRHGGLGVFVARFVPGLRFLAGPIAGASRVGVLAFVVANFLGAVLYVPYAVGIGCALGYGLGAWVDRLRRAIGDVEKIAAVAALVVVAAILGWRVRRVRRSAGRTPSLPT
jgi:membrane protein DedA with SNARE-associated domain